MYADFEGELKELNMGIPVWLEGDPIVANGTRYVLGYDRIGPMWHIGVKYADSMGQQAGMPILDSGRAVRVAWR